MYVLRVKSKDAQSTIELLKEKGDYDFSRRIVREDDTVFVPINKELPDSIKKELPLTSQKKSLKELFGIGSFDIVGDIIIVYIPDRIWSKRSDIGKQAKALYPRIKAVFAKKGAVSGEYRLPELELIYGEGSETIHKERGLRFKTDVKKAYFSPRQGSEREKLIDYVEPTDRVAVLFAGIGPLPVYFSKLTSAKEIIAVEVNPDAFHYLEENLKLNKCRNVTPVCGDVKKIYQTLGDFDLVVLPLPKSSIDFLKEVDYILKPDGRAIFYVASNEKNLLDKIKKIETKFVVSEVRKEIEISPGEFRFVIQVRRL
ncbi:MAG: hypothetical protein GOV01_01285 [Candidatus Altiarchaeota archaeon]|nr:hypothetical protein [Candidatus Altiarchaeota archaeon]